MTLWHCNPCGAITPEPDWRPTPGYGAVTGLQPDDCREAEGVNVCPVCGSDDIEMIRKAVLV